MGNTLLMMMGGSGTRLGANVPKQYIEVEGKPVFYYIVKKYAQMGEISNLCIVSHPDWTDFVEKSISDIGFSCRVIVTNGGNSRSESVRNGLRAIERFSLPDDVVLIHDATHPYVDVKGVEQVINATRECGGATLGAYQYDTCYQMDSDNNIVKVIPRQEIVAGASPEAFLYKKISEIYFSSSNEELSQMTSAGAMALAHGIKMKVVQANVLNLKITYPEDLKLFKLLVSNYFFDKGEN